MGAAIIGLEIARSVGVTTELNPVPAAELPEGLQTLSDFVTPNQTDCAALTAVV